MSHSSNVPPPPPGQLALLMETVSDFTPEMEEQLLHLYGQAVQLAVRKKEEAAEKGDVGGGTRASTSTDTAGTATKAELPPADGDGDACKVLSTAAAASDARGGGDDEEEGPPITWIPTELLCIIFLLVDAKTLMRTIPQVCKLWRNVCQELDGVHLDFTWFGGGKTIPLGVLVGWWVLRRPFSDVDQFQYEHVPEGAIACVGDSSATASVGQQEEGGWASGMCEVFPRATSVTMSSEQGVEDAHLVLLAERCPGITYANFSDCRNLTDAALIALADKCPGLKHANFGLCENLTDAAVIALADKCPGMKDANFAECYNLTDAAVIALADKCHRLTHADFGDCVNLTDAAVLALADKCRGLMYANFSCDMEEESNLTDAAVVALADKCRGLEHADFDYCENLTDAAVFALLANCPRLKSANFDSCRSLTIAARIALAAKMIKDVKAQDFEAAIEVTRQCRVILSEERNPPIQAVIDV